MLKIENKEGLNTELRGQNSMSRRRKAEKREIIPDPKFNDRVLSRFINIVMNDGKKSTAEKIVYKALEIASSKLNVKNSLDLFKSALNNVKPGIEVRNDRALALAIRWIVDSSRKRSEKSMTQRLAQELVDANENKGVSIKKKKILIKWLKLIELSLTIDGKS